MERKIATFVSRIFRKIAIQTSCCLRMLPEWNIGQVNTFEVTRRQFLGEM